MKRISPPGSSRVVRILAAPSSIAVCPSWPQACIAPGFSEAKSTPLSSVMGSASMSARSATVGPGRPVDSRATTLFSVGRSISSPSNVSSVCATNAAVSRSSKLGSGWRCRCRRQSMTCPSGTSIRP
jgi:hypothetical protein